MILTEQQLKLNWAWLKGNKTKYQPAIYKLYLKI